MTRKEKRALAVLRELEAQGWQTEALLVDGCAEEIGDRKTAQRVYDKFFKIFTAN